MNNYKSKPVKLSVSNRCRVCLEQAEKLYPLQGPIANCDVDVNTMITYCTSIELELTENFPHGVCVPCFRTVRIAYNFILQFRENNNILTSDKEADFETVKNTYVSLEGEEFESHEESNNIKIERTELVSKYDIIDSDDVTENYLEQDTDEYLQQEAEEVIEYEEADNQEIIEEQQDFEQYDQQDVEMQNINFLIDNVSTNVPDTTTNFQHVTVKVVKQAPVPETNKPQTVLRRKIKIRFACPVCPKVYFANFEGGLVPHMSAHSEFFTCNVCSNNDTLFNADSFLNHFMQYHRYQCPYCGKSFNKTGTLTAHIKTHYKFRYHCSHESCSKSFPTQWSLKKHEAVHSNLCEYACAECKMEFKTYDTYMYHQKKHGGRKFLCMCCGRTFMQSVHLKYHMQQHTGIKHFKCNYCVKSYTSSSQLKKHKRRHHPDLVETVDRPSETPYIVNIESERPSYFVNLDT